MENSTNEHNHEPDDLEVSKENSYVLKCTYKKGNPRTVTKAPHKIGRIGKRFFSEGSFLICWTEEINVDSLYLCAKLGFVNSSEGDIIFGEKQSKHVSYNSDPYRLFPEVTHRNHKIKTYIIHGVGLNARLQFSGPCPRHDSTLIVTKNQDDNIVFANPAVKVGATIKLIGPDLFSKATWLKDDILLAKRSVEGEHLFEVKQETSMDEHYFCIKTKESEKVYSIVVTEHGLDEVQFGTECPNIFRPRIKPEHHLLIARDNINKEVKFENQTFKLHQGYEPVLVSKSELPSRLKLQNQNFTQKMQNQMGEEADIVLDGF